MTERVVSKDEIESLLPHRGRALLLDTIELINGGAVGYLTVCEEHCEGHFPGFPIMRGVDRLEMIAQTLLAIVALRDPDLSKNHVCYLAGFEKARFPNPAVLGDLVHSEVEVVRKSRRLIIGNGKAYVGDKIVAEVDGISGFLGGVLPHV